MWKISVDEWCKRRFMELRDYLAIIGRRFWWFLLVIGVISLASLVFSLTRPEDYNASSSVTVSKKQSQQIKDTDYQYDSYYALQASSLYADLTTSLLKDPSNVKEIYNKANLEIPTLKLKSLAKLITTRKFQPASIQITVSQDTKDAANSLLNNTLGFIKEYNSNLEKNSQSGSFNLSFSEPLVVKNEVSVLLNTVIGFILGLVLGMCLVFMLEYFRPSKK